jgi:hypothetical protein
MENPGAGLCMGQTALPFASHFATQNAKPHPNFHFEYMDLPQELQARQRPRLHRSRMEAGSRPDPGLAIYGNRIGTFRVGEI